MGKTSSCSTALNISDMLLKLQNAKTSTVPVNSKIVREVKYRKIVDSIFQCARAQKRSHTFENGAAGTESCGSP